MRGGLRGIFKSDYQWADGPNTARCLRTPFRRPGAPVVGNLNRVGGREHELLMPECGCGFWAYTSGEHILSVPVPAVLGVVEGWGRMVLGPHGFRAEKARIVALTFPEVHDDSEVEVPIDTIESRIRDVALVFRDVGLKAARLARMLKIATTPPRDQPTISAATDRWPATHVQPDRTVMQHGRLRALRPWELVDPVLQRQVARAYPSARMFTSLEAMQREFPVSDLQGLLGVGDEQ